MEPDASCLILDGGRATRFEGRQKALLELGTRSFADRMRAVVEPIFTELLVATRHGEAWPRDARIVEDPVPDAGPLAGIAAGLAAATNPLVFVVACDMPCLSGPVILELLERARRARGHALVPRAAGRPEPLHAVYPSALAGEALRALNAGCRKLTDFLELESVPLTWVDAAELAHLPGAGDAFANVNRPADLERLRERLLGPERG